MRANKTLRLLALCGAVALSAYGVVIGISDMRKCARNDDGWFVLTHHSSTAGDPILDGASGLFVAATFAMAAIDAAKAPDLDNSGPR